MADYRLSLTRKRRRNTGDAAVSPGARAHGVEYFTRVDCPGEFFKCRPMALTMRREACAEWWMRARDGKGRDQCRGCHVGATHAGQSAVNLSPIFGEKVCSRCNCCDRRMIFGDLCVSCYNRQREIFGRCNSRGNPPSRFKPLFPMELLLATAGSVVRHVSPGARDLLEVMVRLLRDTESALAFGFTSKPREVAL